MDPIYKPLTIKEKENLSERGLKEWEYLGIPKWADPDSTEYHIGSGLALALSFYGRYVARKNHLPCALYSINILMIPGLYYMAFKRKHVDFEITSLRKRPTFNQCLEFYPITRRAWNRAIELRNQEMNEIKSVIDKLE